jgi:voltage-gated potassium channel
MRVRRSSASRGQRAAVAHGRSSWAVLCTVGLLSIVALLLGIAEGFLAAVVIGSVILLVAAFHYVLRAGRAFAFALANLIGIYACVFLFFTEINFSQVSIEVLSVGYLLPLLTFLLGSIMRRRDIHRIVLSGRMREEQRFARVVLWLVPVFAVGAFASLLPHGPNSTVAQGMGLISGMLVISAIVFSVSHDVAVFLLDTGILFEQFFSRITRLFVPAFAFLTFYSLLVLMFASLYFIMDHLSGQANFRLDGAASIVTFSESLYFSVMTLSTVGYGDIAPATNLARFVVAFEVVCGIFLLLFGFNEIFSFAREQERQHHNASPSSRNDAR